jgi:hypothetical protein
MPVVPVRSAPSFPRGYSLEIIEITASTTLTDNHRDRLLQVNSGSGVTLTLPATFAPGWHCRVESLGAGTVTFAAASGATLNNSFSYSTIGQYGTASLHVSTNVSNASAAWALSGTGVSGLTSTPAELNMLDNAVASVSWAVAAGAANVCIMTGTIKDAAGATIAASRPLLVYISEAAIGIGITADSYSTGAAITTGTSLVAFTANKAWLINTHTDGTFAISITDTAKPADQYGAALTFSKGQLSVSAASAALWGA